MAFSDVSTLELTDRFVGLTTAPRSMRVDPDRIAAFAEATDDARGIAAAADVAPTAFAVVPVMEPILDALELLTGDRTFPLRMLHLGHDIRTVRPIRPGEQLHAHAAVRGIRTRSAGVVVGVALVTHSSNGATVNEHDMTLLFRDAVGPDVAGDTPAPPARTERSGPPLDRLTKAVADDVTSRYARASGDLNPIHLDDAAAQAAGLPRRIVHGLCTLALCARDVAALCTEEDTSRLQRISCRFARPVFPGDLFATSVWRYSEAFVCFETQVGDAVVVKDGHAIVSNAGVNPSTRRGERVAWAR